MDDIQFKFWDEEKKVMIPWDCVCQTAFNRLRTEGNEIQRYGLMYYLFTTPERFIPLQFTGKKDIKQKPIHRGDILRSDDYPFMSHGQDNYYAEVCWDDESASYFYYTFKNPKFNDVSGISTGNTGDLSEYAWEIIGNIYENPELLEVTNKIKENKEWK